MRIILMTMLAAALAFTTTASAQRRTAKSTVKKPAPVVEDPRISQMLETMQKVTFIDSMVVDDRDYMKHIPLAAECGTPRQNEGLGQYTNELGDHRLTTVYSDADSATHIMQSDFVGRQWTAAKPVKGLSGAAANNPFLMPDGITLYYAQRGERSLGGYDIFVTRYDAESGSFLKPENIGMPFASEANDLFYAIDEINQLGYFVTDRRQPRGKVCIYVFIPNTTRQAYAADSYSDTDLRQLARISSIASTWSDKSTLKQAQARLENARAATLKRQQPQTETQLTETERLRQQTEKMAKSLKEARQAYAHATPAERKAMTAELAKTERQLEYQLLVLRQKEKEERNRQFNNQQQ